MSIPWLKSKLESLNYEVNGIKKCNLIRVLTNTNQTL